MAYQSNSSIGIPREKRRSFIPAPKSYSRFSSSADPDLGDTKVDTAPQQSFSLGSHVCISGIKTGTVKYLGPVHITDGLWCGIELDEPDGKHDGQVDGRRYFFCHPCHGIFAPIEKVALVASLDSRAPDLVETVLNASNLQKPIRKSRLLKPGNLTKTAAEPEVKEKLLNTDFPYIDAFSSEPEVQIQSKLTRFAIQAKPGTLTTWKQQVKLKSEGETGSPNISWTGDVNKDLEEIKTEESKVLNKTITHEKTRDRLSELSQAIPKPGKSLHNAGHSKLPHIIKANEFSLTSEKGAEVPHVSESTYGLNSTYVIERGKQQQLADICGNPDSEELSNNVIEHLESDRRQYFNFTFDAESGSSHSPSIPDVLPESAFRIEEEIGEALWELEDTDSEFDLCSDELDLDETKVEQSSLELLPSDILETNNLSEIYREENLTTQKGNENYNLSCITGLRNYILSKESEVLTSSISEKNEVKIETAFSDLSPVVSKGSILNRTFCHSGLATVPIDQVDQLHLKSPLEGNSVKSLNSVFTCGKIDDTEGLLSQLNVQQLPALMTDSGIIMKEVEESSEIVSSDHKLDDKREGILFSKVSFAAENFKGSVSEQEQLVADLQAGHSKKDRPVSLISTTSVDTGYVPDTDSEVGILTTSSPLEWLENPTGHFRPLKESSYNECSQNRGGTIKIVDIENDSALCYGIGTVSVGKTGREDLEREPFESVADNSDLNPVVEAKDKGDLKGDLSETFTRDTNADEVNANDERLEEEDLKDSLLDRDGTTLKVCKGQTSLSSLDIFDDSEGSQEKPPDATVNSDKDLSSEGTDETLQKSEEMEDASIDSLQNVSGSKVSETKSSVKKREKIDHKKSNINVVSRLHDYISAPVPGKSKEESTDSKSKKNATNKKKADIKKTEDLIPKPLDKQLTRRDSGDAKTTKIQRIKPPEKEIPKIKRSMPKSKWSSVMSQIEANRDAPKPKTKVEIKSSLAEYMNTPLKNVGSKNDVKKQSSKKIITSTPKPDYSKVKSKLCFASSAHSTNHAGKADNNGRRVSELSGSLISSGAGSLISSTRSSRSDLSGLVMNEGSSSSKVKVGAIHHKNSTLIKNDRPDSASSSRTDATQSSIKAMNAKNTQKNQVSYKRSSVKTSIPPPAPRKCTTLPKLSSKMTDVSSKDKSKAKLLKHVANQNKNKTSRPKGTAHLKLSNQPDLVSNSVGANASKEISRLEALCEARTKELNYTKMQLKAGLAGFDAMSVLVNYLTHELDAFSCPVVGEKLKRVQGQLNDTQEHILSLQQRTVQLEQEIVDLNKQHEKALTELIAEKNRALLSQKESLTQQHVETLQKVHDQHTQDTARLKQHHQQLIAELKIHHESEVGSIQDSHMLDVHKLQEKHDCQMEELHKQHKDKLEEITVTFEEIKRCLSEKVEALRCECEELRSRARLCEETLERDADVKVQVALAPYKDLPQEIESLKHVIEMRNEEIRELRMLRIDLEKQLEELPLAQEKVITLQQKVENLEAILNIKADQEKQMNERCQHLLRKCNKETQANKRLSMDYEELKWRMSQGDLHGSQEIATQHFNISPSGSESGSPDRKVQPSSSSEVQKSPSKGSRDDKMSASVSGDGTIEWRVKCRPRTYAVSDNSLHGSLKHSYTSPASPSKMSQSWTCSGEGRSTKLHESTVEKPPKAMPPSPPQQESVKESEV